MKVHTAHARPILCTNCHLQTFPSDLLLRSQPKTTIYLSVSDISLYSKSGSLNVIKTSTVQSEVQKGFANALRKCEQQLQNQGAEHLLNTK